MDQSSEGPVQRQHSLAILKKSRFLCTGHELLARHKRKRQRFRHDDHDNNHTNVDQSNRNQSNDMRRYILKPSSSMAKSKRKLLLLSLLSYMCLMFMLGDFLNLDNINNNINYESYINEQDNDERNFHCASDCNFINSIEVNRRLPQQKQGIFNDAQLSSDSSKPKQLGEFCGKDSGDKKTATAAAKVETETETETTTTTSSNNLITSFGTYISSSINRIISTRPLRSSGKFSFFMFASANSDANRLYEDLMMTYDKIIRPVANASEGVVVKLSLKLSQLIDVSMDYPKMYTTLQANFANDWHSNLKNQMMTTNVWLNQEWFDYKLKWDPVEYGGILEMNLPAEQIWLPDIVLYNSNEGGFAVTIMTKAKVRYDGLVTWNPPAIFRSWCEIDITYFPFDSQKCHMKFGSWTFDGTLLNLRHQNDTNGTVHNGADLSEYYQNVEWDVMEASAERHVIKYGCCSDIYHDVTFYFRLRRKPLFYTVNLILPCVGITILSFFVFYLPSDSGEKVTLTISTLLSLIFFLSVLIETIPSTSLAMPILGKYLVFTLVLITLSVCATVCVLNIHFRTPSTHSMPPWVKRWCVEILPKYLFVNVPQYQTDQQTYILPEQLIYPHNSAYLNNQTQQQQQQQKARPNSAASGWPIDSQLNPTAASKHKQAGKVSKIKQLNPGSLDMDTAPNALSMSHSSLFLPYLHSEAARRLQMQRSRSSDRDQKSSSDNQNQQSATSGTDGNSNLETLALNKQNRSDSNYRIHMIPATSNASNEQQQQQHQQQIRQQLAKHDNKSSLGDDKSVDTTKSQSKISLFSRLIGRQGRRGSSNPEDQSDQYSCSSSRRKSSFGLQLFGESKVNDESSSSAENDYQYHNNFQARASICSTNMWRVGPARLTAVPVAPNYPTYYRPIVQLAKSGHPESALYLDGNRISEINSSLSESSSSTHGPNYQAPWNQQTCNLTHLHPSQLNSAGQQEVTEMLIRGERSDPVQLSAASFRLTSDSRGSNRDSESTPLPSPPPPLPMYSSGIRNENQVPRSYPTGYHVFGQQQSDPIILNPATLIRGQARHPMQRLTTCLYDNQGFEQTNPTMLTTSQMMMMPPKLRSTSKNSFDTMANHQTADIGHICQPQSLDSRVIFIPKSRSIDNRLGNIPNTYIGETTRIVQPSVSDLRNTSFIDPSVGQTQHNDRLGTSQMIQNFPQIRIQQNHNPLTIGRALGQAYVQRLTRQPTVHSLPRPHSPQNQHQSRRVLNQPLDVSQRGQIYLKSFDSYRMQQQQQQRQEQGIRRSKSHGSLIRRAQHPTLSTFDQYNETEFDALDRSMTLRRRNGSHKINGQQKNYTTGKQEPKQSAEQCYCSRQNGSKVYLNGQPVARRVQPLAMLHPAQARLVVAKLIHEVDKAIQNAMFIAQHIDNYDEFESVKENWKYIAMVIDRIFLIVFLFAGIVGTIAIFGMVPWFNYIEKPIELHMSNSQMNGPEIANDNSMLRSCSDL